MIELILIFISMFIGHASGINIMRKHYKKKISDLEEENKDLKEARDLWVNLYHQDAVNILERN